MSDVGKRCVFYVSGFDPKGASHYHALYQQEAAKQSQINGWHFDVGVRKRLAGGNSFWTVQSFKANRSDEGATDPVTTHYEFMRWDDVVRQHWPMRTLTLWGDVLTTSFFNLRHGSWWQMFKLSWPPAVALIAPLLVLLFTVVLAPLLAFGLGVSVVVVLAWPAWAGVLCAVFCLAVCLGLGRFAESRYSMYWLIRSYAFTARQALGQVPEMNKRIDKMAERLLERYQAQEDDEILLVAHSSGTVMAVSILARFFEALKADGIDPITIKVKLSLLTLGQCIPLLASLPQANQFRRELSILASSKTMDWIDFSAPPDGCCFALSDPLALADGEVLRPPKLLSPKFADMFSPAHYKALRKDKFRIHFQYLMASEYAVDFDFFLITAGDQTLAKRFRAAPSVMGYSALRPF